MDLMNIMQNLIKNGKNPQQMAMSMLQNNGNPILNNLMIMAKKGDNKGIENFARNLFKEKGRNFDEEFSNFKSNFK